MNVFFQSFGSMLHDAIPTINALSGLANSGNVGGNITELPALNVDIVACDDIFFVQPDGTIVNLFTVKELYNTKSSQIVNPTEILQIENKVTSATYGSNTVTKIRDVTFFKDLSSTEEDFYGDFTESPENWFDYRCVAELHQDLIITGLKSSNLPAGDLNLVIPQTIGGKPVVGIDSHFNSVLVGMNYVEIHPVVSIKTKSIMGLSNECFLNCTSLEEIWMPNCISLGKSFVKGCTALESIYVGSSTINIVKDAFEGSSNFVFRFPAGDDYLVTLSDETLSRVCYPYDSGVSGSRWSVEEKMSVTSTGIGAITTAFKSELETKLNNTALYGSVGASSKPFGYTVDNDVDSIKLNYKRILTSSVSTYVLDSSGTVDGSEGTVTWNKYIETTTEVYSNVNDATDYSSSTVRVVRFELGHIQRLFMSFNDNLGCITSVNLYVSDTEPTSVTDGTILGAFEPNGSNVLGLDINYTTATGNVYFWTVPTISVSAANISGYADDFDGYPAIEIDPNTGETSFPIMLPPFGYANYSNLNMTRAEEDYDIYSPWDTFPSDWLIYEFYTVGMDQFVRVTGIHEELLPNGLTSIEIRFPLTIEGKTVKKLGANFNSDSLSGLEKLPITKIYSTTITLIEDSAFENCATLSEVDVSSLQEVGVDCFRNTGCSYYNVPSLVTIGAGAFADAGINAPVLLGGVVGEHIAGTGFNVFLYLGSTVPSIGEGAFRDSSSLTALYPYGADIAGSMYNFGSLYDATPSASESVYCLPYTTAVKGATFNLVSVTFDIEFCNFIDGSTSCTRKYKLGEAYNSFPTVLNDGFYVFDYWINISGVQIPTTALASQFVTSLTGELIQDFMVFTLNNDNVSYSLSSLKAGVELWDAFYMLIPPTHNSLPVTRISDNFNSHPLYGNELYKIQRMVATSVTLVGDNAFENCSTLEEVEISSLVEVGINSFKNCGCAFYNVPSLVTIEDGAFSDAVSNVLLYLGNTVPSIGEGSFNNSSDMLALYPYGADVASSMYNFGSLYDATPSAVDSVYCIPYTTATKGATFNLVSVTFVSKYETFINGESSCIRKYKIGEMYRSLPTIVTSTFSIFEKWITYPNIDVLTTDLADQAVTYIEEQCIDNYFVYTLNPGNASYALSSLKSGMEAFDNLDVVIPEVYNGKPVTKIYDEFNCQQTSRKYNIRSISGDSITTVGNRAFFYGYTGESVLQNIDLPNLSTCEGDYSFGGNKVLGDIIFNNLTSCGRGSFSAVVANSFSSSSLVTGNDASFRLSTFGNLSLPAFQNAGLLEFTQANVENLELPSLISSGNFCFSGFIGTTLKLPSLVSLGGVETCFKDIVLEELWTTSITHLGTSPFEGVETTTMNVYCGATVPTYTTSLGTKPRPGGGNPRLPIVVIFRYPQGATWPATLGGCQCLPYTP